MREIRFRGYNGLGWIYSETIRYNSEDEQWYMMSEETGEWDYVNQVGQYTGLKDKNGVAIYEGDIIKATYFNHAYLLRVIYDSDTLAFCVVEEDSCICPLSNYKKHYVIEVIGNIYENPELLKEVRLNKKGKRNLF